jgi:hypothetical protein
VDFTSPAFFLDFFPPRLRLSQNFYLKEMRLKMFATCKVIGLRLCFHGTIGFLLHRSQRHILCHSARSKQTIFLRRIVALQGRKQWPQFSCLYCKDARDMHLLIAKSNDNNNCIFYLYCNEQATMTTFFISHCKGASKYNKNSNISGDARASCKGMMTMQQSNVICCIARGNNIDTFFIVLRGSERTSYCEGVSINKGQLQGYGNDGPPCNNHTFICC